MTVTDRPERPVQGPPKEVADYATRAVEYVQRALGVALEYDSDTLPLLDHYLGTVPLDQPATVALVVATSGAYFGEVVRRRLGGRWEGTSEEVAEWRVVLPTAVQFSPTGMVAAALAKDEVDDFDSGLDAPPRMRPYVAEALARMGEVTEEDYYSLCGRLDTIEHVHDVLLAVAAKLLGNPETAEVPEGDDPEPN
jgi:hypothetical protein